MHRAALYTAAAVFAVVSALHWIRYFTHTEITIAGAAVPLSASLAGGVVLAALAAWMVIAARRR